MYTGLAERIVVAGLIALAVLILIPAPAQSTPATSQAAHPEPAHARLASEMIPRMIAWIAASTGWKGQPAPPVHFATPAQLARMLYGENAGADRICPTALYSIERHEVYLSTAWKADDLRDRSMLLHELVHHLQVLDKVKVDCQALYDRQAYHWQTTWLREQGIAEPYKFLRLNEFTVYTMTSCPNYY